MPQWRIWRTERVSELYGLDANQSELEFIDVDVVADTRLYVDPRALRQLAETDAWAEECAALLRDFFEQVIKAVKAGDEDGGLALLAGLSEPNDTRLGMSSREARGNAVGPELAERIWKNLAASEAAQTGLLEDLEDTALVIPLIATDRISDITTNVIRGPLIAFTQDVCQAHPSIETEAVPTGLIWDKDSHSWLTDEREELPVPKGRPLVLVPKSIARAKLDFDPGDYYNHVLRWLAGWELDHPAGGLVEILKNGRHRVTRKSVVRKYRGKYGNSQKQVNNKATLDHTEILESYRRQKDNPLRRPSPPTYRELSELTGAPAPDLGALLAAVRKVPRGKTGASRYHQAIEELLDVLFWPELQFGESEVKTHGGRKRLDVRYVNTREGSGFFSWLAENYGSAAHVTVECKNYREDVANPELDQLLGRFSNLNGKVGILTCRGFKDKKAFLERCNEAAKGGQGFVILLDDGDLATLVGLRRKGDNEGFRSFLYKRFHEIID